jgi:phage tail protein X
LSKYRRYKTLQGDTWDAIALDFYGDEKYASNIIAANSAYVKTIIFDAGIELKIPIMEDTAASTLPPWRT